MEIDEVRQVADLARIALDDDEAREMAESLSAVLALVDGLDDEALEGVEPLRHCLDIFQQLRADRVSEGDCREDLQAVAPQVAEGLYLVPKVLE